MKRVSVTGCCHDSMEEDEYEQSEHEWARGR